MNRIGWHDSLLWSIRPDCQQDARSVLQRIAEQNGKPLTPESAGLHRDSLWRNLTSSYARWFGLDELPIDMVEGGIAIVSVIGPLVNIVNPYTANYPLLTAAFERCLQDSAVKAVCVRFNTPGGTVSGLAECAKALDALAEAKLTVGQVDGGCYSAGYYLACQCGSICCGATDHVGNIGTVTSLWDYSEYFASEGVRTIVKRTGAIKGLGILGDPVTEVQETFLQEMTDAHFAHFKSAVMAGRDMDEDEFSAVSDGRWWLGEQAVNNKVIDRVSALSETLAAIKDQASSV